MTFGEYDFGQTNHEEYAPFHVAGNPGLTPIDSEESGRGPS